jgi:hypothetical protein
MPQPKPRIDDHVATPETREEYIDGRIVQVAPAKYEHAVAHIRLDYVLEASVAPGYTATTDMLTRTSHDWDFAADAAILKEGVDPDTGTRYLEELAFEIKNTQRMSDLTMIASAPRRAQVAPAMVAHEAGVCIRHIAPLESRLVCVDGRNIQFEIHILARRRSHAVCRCRDRARHMRM